MPRTYHFVCLHCGKASSGKGARPRKFCSHRCHGLWMRGENHYMYKGGSYRHGYKFVRDGDRYRQEHRAIAERMLGRELLPNECVHHKDGNRSNNDPQNLEVLASNKEHRRRHAKYFASETEKQCSICLEVKPRSEFSTRGTAESSHGRDPHDSRCKACNRVRCLKQWHARNGPRDVFEM